MIYSGNSCCSSLSRFEENGRRGAYVYEGATMALSSCHVSGTIPAPNNNNNRRVWIREVIPPLLLILQCKQAR